MKKRFLLASILSLGMLLTSCTNHNNSKPDDPVEPTDPTKTDIVVSEAREIISKLAVGETTTTEYTISGYVWSGFEPTIGTSGDYKFNICDKDEANAQTLICWYLKPNGFSLPQKGDKVKVAGKLANHDGKQYEVVDGKVTSLTHDGEDNPGPVVPPSGDVLSVSQARQIASGLLKGDKSTSEYTISGYVWSGFEPAQGTSGDFKFDICDEDKDNVDVLICWYLKPNGFSLPKGGDKITVQGKLQNYDETKLEVVEGKVTALTHDDGDNPGPVNPTSPVTATVAEAILATKALDKNAESTVEFLVTGYVWGGFEPSEGSSGDFKFDLVNSQNDVENDNAEFLVIYYADPNGFDLPNEGDLVTIQGTLKNYFDKNNKNLLEIIDGIIIDVEEPEPYVPTYTVKSVTEEISNIVLGSAIEGEDYEWVAEYDMYQITDVTNVNEYDSWEATAVAYMGKLPLYLFVSSEYEEIEDESVQVGLLVLVTEVDDIYVEICVSDSFIAGCYTVLINIYEDIQSSDGDYTQKSVIEDICLLLWESAIEDEDYWFDDSDNSYATYYLTEGESLEDVNNDAVLYLPYYLEEYYSFATEGEGTEEFGYSDYCTSDESIFVDIVVYFDTEEQSYCVYISVYLPADFWNLFE